MFLNNFYKERVLYGRRQQLMDILDGFAKDAFYNEDFTMKDDDPRMIILRKQFSDVLNPANIEEELKRIYPKHLYKI